MSFDLVEFVVLACTFVIAVYQTWGLWKQWRTIVQARSGRAVALYPHVANLAYFIASLAYSVFTVRWLQGGAALSSGIITALILYSLGLYEKWGMKQFAVLSLLPLWLIAILAIERGGGESFAIISVVAVLVTFSQPYTLWREKSVGSVDIRLVVSFAVGAAFWSFYGWVTHEPINSVVCPIFFLSHMTTIKLYYRYR